MKKLITLCFALSFFYFAANAKILLSGKNFSTRAGCVATNVLAAQSNDNLLVTWTPVDSGECPQASAYKVSYTVDGETNLVNAVPPLNIALIEDVELSCQKVGVTVITLDAAGDPLDESPLVEYVPTLPLVNGLDIREVDGGIELSWDQPDYADRCSLTYTVKIVRDGGEESPVEDITGNSHLVALVDLKSCESILFSITAVSGEFHSDPVSLNFETAIGKVQNFDLFMNEGKVTTDFEPSLNIDNCGSVKYRVVQEDQRCFKIEINVIPISESGKSGLEEIGTIDKGPGPVLNLDATATTDKITVTWDYPIGGENCDLAYIVRYREHSGSIHILSYDLNLETKACEEDDIIVSAVTGEEGERSVFNFKGVPQAVNNFGCSASVGNIQCSWEPPIDSEVCENIEYAISYSNGAITNSLITTELSYDFVPEDCKNSWIYIRAQSGTAVGQLLEKSFDEIDCAETA